MALGQIHGKPSGEKQSLFKVRNFQLLFIRQIKTLHEFGILSSGDFGLAQMTLSQNHNTNSIRS